MKPYFDRFDVCEAHRAIEIHYNLGGWLHERPSNRRRMEATHVQLDRMGYRPAPTRLDCFVALSPNGKAIYGTLEARYGFRKSRRTAS
jgi:hypothetical protein